MTIENGSPEPTWDFRKERFGDPFSYTMRDLGYHGLAGEIIELPLERSDLANLSCKTRVDDTFWKWNIQISDDIANNLPRVIDRDILVKVASNPALSITDLRLLHIFPPPVPIQRTDSMLYNGVQVLKDQYLYILILRKLGRRIEQLASAQGEEPNKWIENLEADILLKVRTRNNTDWQEYQKNRT